MADKKYKLNFNMSDGTAESVEFTAPQGKTAYDYAKEGGYGGSEENFAKKLAIPCVTPQMYGAKGDGSTDDTTAFRNALANNRVVYVPGGTYKLSNGIVIGDNCSLILSQDTVLNFTNTDGYCISLGMISMLGGNHATVNVPYEFSGNVIYAYSNDKSNADILSVPPFSRWDPQWKSGRYITDINICKADSRGFHYAVNPGDCKGSAVYLSTDGDSSGQTFMWGIHFSGLRIAGAFSYGIRAVNLNAGWMHEMRIDAFIDACEIGVSLEDCNNSYISTIIQPRRAYTLEGVYEPYAKHGIQLIRSKNTDLSGSRVWDWDAEKTLWTDGGVYQHIAMIGDCGKTIVNDFNYSNLSDTRDRIYTDTLSNLDQIIIIQEPITRWFKSVNNVPFYSDGFVEKKIITQSELDAHFKTDVVKNFTDRLATAIDKDGNIFNNIGYKIGVRVPTDGSTPIDAAYYGCTGFISCQKGSQINAEGMSFEVGDDYCQILLFDANFNKIVHVNRGLLIKGNNYYVSYSPTDTGFSCTINNVGELNNVAYARFNIYKTQWGDNPMIAIDEEIKYVVKGFLADGINVKGQNVILYSPAGKAFRLAVDDNGNVTANEIV